MPRVTALMPLYNGITYIRESLESVQAQTFTDWEFIIVNDFGSDDGCADVIREYAEKDPRIKLVQLEERLGLAASLNVGMDMAQGEYIARVDVDDPSMPERFAKQVTFLDEHPEICLCSCWMKTVTPSESHLEKMAVGAEMIKAASMFGCQICHAGAMLRKVDFDKNNWRYNPDYLSEDHELWTRIQIEGAKIDNIPEPLVIHRWGFGSGLTMTKGEKLREEVRKTNKRYIENIGLNCENYNKYLFSGWNHRPIEYAKKNIPGFIRDNCRLMEELQMVNDKTGFFGKVALKTILLQRFDWVRKSCGLSYLPCEEWPEAPAIITPVISVVLPTFRSAVFISKAIDSVLTQSFADWELLVVNDFGSDDGTAEMVKMYAWADSRIRLIQADRRLGLADSLNLGIREARGKYIARLDADDTALPERFAKQVAYMDAHPEVGVCGTWQQHYGNGREWVHKADPDPKRLRCKLLFWCDLCHSTLMLRRSVFIENQLFYDPHAKAEDFELWTRAMEYTELASIPEVLGTYNESTGITNNKLQELATESGEITERTIRRILEIHLKPGDCRLLNGWINPISQDEKRKQELERLREILTEILQKNETVGFFDSKQLLQVLTAKWFWAKDNIDWKTTDYRSVKSIEDAFSDKYRPSFIARYQMFRENNPKASVRVKKIIKRIFRPIARFSRRVIKLLLKDAIQEINRDIEHWTWDRCWRIDKAIEQWTWDRFQRTDKAIERWTWDRFQRTDKAIERWTWERCNRIFENAKGYQIPYYTGQRIRVLFLFQVASFWPAQEEIYLQLKSDKRFEVVLICYDDDFDKSIKTETARNYLTENGYDFIPWDNFSFKDFNPHIVFLQTAYDSNRRGIFTSTNIKQYGSRPIYIPYGIEIADTQHAHLDHFRKPIISNAWKVYTFSENMRLEYLRHIHSRTSVVALGLPRFDPLFHKERFPQHAEVVSRAAGRRVILWKVHFPKVISDGSRNVLVTPDINEYIKFAEILENNYSDLFFVFMPHPRFREFNDDEIVKQQTRELMTILETKQNVYIDDADDYRPSLLNADAIIVDRSAVMIEAAVVDVPILYMSNADFYEPMTDAVAPLVESYEQGQTCEDMIAFVERCRKGLDVNRERRNAAFRQCIPYFDGKCAERIKEDIVRSLEAEREQDLQSQLTRQTAQLEDRIERLETLVESRLNAQAQQTEHCISAALDTAKADILPQIDKSTERWTWERYTRSKRDVEKQTWNLMFENNPEKMLNLVQSPIYDFRFYLDNRYGSINSAQRVLYKLFQFLPHASVVDFGCGSGTWLWVAQAFGAQEVLGIDGPYVPESMRLISKAQFMPANLEERIELPGRFDLAMSLEVAEHLSPDAADGFVESICNAANVVIFSAAHPGQGGSHHINEQPMEYWIEKFAVCGYRPIVIRQLFAEDGAIEKWYRDNIILFAAEANYDELAEAVRTTT